MVVFDGVVQEREKGKGENGSGEGRKRCKKRRKARRGKGEGKRKRCKNGRIEREMGGPEGRECFWKPNNPGGIMEKLELKNVVTLYL